MRINEHAPKKQEEPKKSEPYTAQLAQLKSDFPKLEESIKEKLSVLE